MSARTSREWRFECLECGRRSWSTRKPKVGGFHWGGPHNGYKKCYEPDPIIETREVGRWERVQEVAK